MCRNKLFAVWLCLALCGAGVGSVRADGLLLLGMGAGPGGAAPPCSQATTFLARTSGLSGTESTAYTTMICGMVTDGTWALLDFLYIFATNTKTTAKLNLVSTSYGLTEVNTCTFVADTYIQNTTNCYLNTGYIPSSAAGHATQNSTAIGACVLNTRSAGSTIEIGGSVGSVGAWDIAPYWTGNLFVGAVNDYIFNQRASTHSNGFWVVSRTASTGWVEYLDGASVGSLTAASGGLPTVAMWILGFNNNGVVANNGFDQLAAVFAGGGMSGPQVTAMHNRISAFVTALGGSGC